MAENRDAWVSNFNNAVNGVSPQNAGVAGEQNTQPQDKYKGLENVSYSELLNSKVQSAAVKEQALKYVNTPLNAGGFQGQGLAESSKLGIYGNYQKSIDEANKVHQQNLMDIEVKKADDLEAQGKERWQSAMEMLSQAQTTEELEQIKNDFYDGFTDDQKKYFDYYYASYGKDIGKAGEYATLDSLRNASIIASMVNQ